MSSVTQSSQRHHPRTETTSEDDVFDDRALPTRTDRLPIRVSRNNNLPCPCRRADADFTWLAGTAEVQKEKKGNE